MTKTKIVKKYRVMQMLFDGSFSVPTYFEYGGYSDIFEETYPSKEDAEKDIIKQSDAHDLLYQMLVIFPVYVSVPEGEAELPKTEIISS